MLDHLGATIPAIDCPDPILPLGAQGIERLAVDDDSAQVVVTFARQIPTGHDDLFRPASYVLSGGRRLFPRVRSASRHNPPGTPFELVDRRVLLGLDGIGDFSVYTLTLTAAGIDPFFASHRLRFRLGCDDPFDCRVPAAAPEPEAELPVSIDYLARDYVSFRQALIDFIPTRMPGWTERSEADVGMMLLELFAHTADELSYLQDRVAMEAFLATASQRRSVAGHLALIGYALDEGAAAWTWLQFSVTEPHALAAERRLRVTTRRHRDDEPLIVFETVTGSSLDPDVNEMFAYDWGNRACCLPKEALRLTLRGRHESLAVGDRILLEHPEPRTDQVAPERPDRWTDQRDIVRLTAVGFVAASANAPELTTVEWSSATPLRHEYCISDDTLVVRGNLVLATHGETFGEDLRDLTDEEKAAVDRERARLAQRRALPRRQRLRLTRGPLTHLDPGTIRLAGLTPTPASRVEPDPSSDAPVSISTLALTIDNETWQQRRTLIDAGPDDRVYRLEIDDLGAATVVFGNGQLGEAPDELATVHADYRVGGGMIGNVAPEALTVPVAASPGELGWLDPQAPVRNPLPAVGGRDPETRQHARRTGPASFLTPLVAVTTADYQAAAMALTIDDAAPIQRAKATFRWTGSWLTVTLAVDPRGSDTVRAAVRQALLAYLDTRRLAGYDLELVPAVYVPIDLVVEFCTADGFRSADVEQELLLALSDDVLRDGKRGAFHPDELTFGDRLFVSRLDAAILRVPGVASAEIVRLCRSRSPRATEETVANLRRGYLQVADDEIIRLDNDRNVPENGTLRLIAKGAA